MVLYLSHLINVIITTILLHRVPVALAGLASSVRQMWRHSPFERVGSEGTVGQPTQTATLSAGQISYQVKKQATAGDPKYASGCWNISLPEMTIHKQTNRNSSDR